MDLRPHLTAAQVPIGARVLNYQPFILADDLQTGIAYSWFRGGDPREQPPLVFRYSDWGAEWEQISARNGALRRMYEDFILEIARRYPAGSLLDVACNNGYFPVRAELAGMRRCAGIDLGRHYRYAVRFLNDVLGTSAKFMHGRYDPRERSMTPGRRYDVVCASAILCHLPDPLEFLACLGRTANEAIFFWGKVIETNEFIIAYDKPHLAFSDEPFPYGFNSDTQLSRGLLIWSLEKMGFREVIELPQREGWLDMPGKHMAVLAMR